MLLWKSNSVRVLFGCTCQAGKSAAWDKAGFKNFDFTGQICIILKRDISITRIALPSFPWKFCSWSWWFLNFPTSEIFIFFFQVFTAFKVIKFEDWSVLKNARHLLVWAYHERLMCMSIREGAYKQIWQFSLPSFLNKRQYSALLRGSVTLRTPGTMMQSWRPNKKKSNERLLRETNSFLNMCPSDEKNLTAC